MYQLNSLFHECLSCASCLRRSPTEAAQVILRFHHVLLFPVVGAEIQFWTPWRFIKPTSSPLHTSCQTTLNFRRSNIYCLAQTMTLCLLAAVPISITWNSHIQKVSWRRTNLQSEISPCNTKLVIFLEKYMITTSGHDFTWFLFYDHRLPWPHWQ